VITIDPANDQRKQLQQQIVVEAANIRRQPGLAKESRKIPAILEHLDATD
jgi:hypothetical protein